MNAEGADFETEHNLRTSVTIIRAASEILSDHPDMPRGERQHFEDTLVTESTKLSRIIDEITAHCSLDFSEGACPERVCCHRIQEQTPTPTLHHRPGSGA